MRDLHIVVVSSSVAKEKVSRSRPLGVVCHVALFLLHAIIAKGWHPSNRLKHAPGSFVLSLSTVDGS